MDNHKIIGFAGRKESGKSVLSNVCAKYGYEIIRFAEPLKQLVSDLIYVKREELDSLKNIKKQYFFQDMDCDFVARETSIPISIVKEKIGNKIFHTVRELLQVIGTDLIREYNADWHVNKTLEFINSKENDGKNFVIDDVRFPNERNLIENMGGTCWFVVRPKTDNVSNHESEISLIWQDFDNIIINDRTQEYLEFNWSIFMENGYEDSLNVRVDLLNKLYGNKNAIEELKQADKDFTLLEAMFITKHEFTYNAKYFNQKEPILKIISTFSDGSVLVGTDEFSSIGEICENPLMIEDLKKYIE